MYDTGRERSEGESLLEAIFAKILGVVKYSTKLFVIVAIISGIVLFAPPAFINQFGLNQLVADYIPYIGGSFIISCVVSIVNLVGFLFEKVKTKIQNTKVMKLRQNRLHSLNNREKWILLYYFEHETNTQLLAINDGTVSELAGYKIIQRATNLSQGGLFFSYNLNPWARQYLMENLHLLQIPDEEATEMRRASQLRNRLW
ncbi:hypothetical protein EBB07_31435 [Paenibacillaceae bacterium]|nr:hypothetical protein EBB07_31435 [Paenibacillaceae bacterium]